MGKLAKEQRRRLRKGMRAWQLSTAAALPPWLARRFAPAVHYLDLWLMDYGAIREVYANLHQVTDGIWRSAQPAPRHLRAAARRGVRRVINLRGEEAHGGYWLEEATCARLGLELVTLRLRSRAAPSHGDIAAMRAAIAAIDGPTLIHCKSGSDRTGLFCALYLIFREGMPVVDARRQLSLRYGHVRVTKTGILDHLFEQYLDDHARSPIPFAEWLETVYDPDALAASFQAEGWPRRAVRSLGLR
ncbi:MAG: beta-lactamase hydrolase domain-containing protein [Hyphomicrobiaceae bacterium]